MADIQWSSWRIINPESGGEAGRIRFRGGLRVEVSRNYVTVHGYLQYDDTWSIGAALLRFWFDSGPFQQDAPISKIPNRQTTSPQWWSLKGKYFSYGSSVSVRLRVMTSSTYNSDAVLNQTVSIPRVEPGSPSSIRAQDITTTSANISWNRPSDDGGSEITQDQVQVAVDGKFTDSASLIYDETGVSSPVSVGEMTPGTRYRARARSQNAQGWGYWKYTSYFETLPLPPEAPTDLQVTRVSDTQQNLSWSNAATYDNVIVRRRDNLNSEWTTLATLTGSAVSYADNSTQADREYTYEVLSANAAGQTPSNSATIQTTPAPPTNAQVQRGVAGLEVTWTRGASYAVPHEVWNADNGTWDPEPLGTAPSGSTKFTHTSPNPLATHQYRVRAITSSGLTSAYALTPIIDIAGPPNAPTVRGPAATQDADNEITLSWTHNPVDYSTQSAYQVRWRYQGDSAWQQLSQVNSSATQDIRPAGFWINDRVVEWQVRNRGAYPGWSPWSKTASFATSSSPTASIIYPSNGEVHNDPRLTVTWAYSDPEGTAQSGWQVRLLNGAGEIVEEDSGSGEVFEHTLDTVLDPDSQWTVQVSVRDGAGAWSEWALASLTVEYSEPAKPNLHLSWQPSGGTIEVQIENNPWSEEDKTILEDAIEEWRPGSVVEWSEYPPDDPTVIWANPLTGEVRWWTEDVCTPGGSEYNRARQALIDAIQGARPDAVITWTETLPGDLDKIWVHPRTGEVQENTEGPLITYDWTGPEDASSSTRTVHYQDGTETLTNLIPNPRGRNIEGV